MGFLILRFYIFKEMGGGSQIKKTLKIFFLFRMRNFPREGVVAHPNPNFFWNKEHVYKWGGGLKVVQQKSKVELCLGLTVSELKIC